MRGRCATYLSVSTVTSMLVVGGCTHQCEKGPCPDALDVASRCAATGQCTADDGPLVCQSLCELAPAQVLVVPMDAVVGDVGTRHALAVWYAADDSQLPLQNPQDTDAHATLAGAPAQQVDVDPSDSVVHFVWDDFSPSGDLAFSYTGDASPADRVQLYFVDLSCAVVHPQEDCEQ
jgi:hypothetical protein